MNRLRVGVFVLVGAIALAGCYDDTQRRDVYDNGDNIAPGTPVDVFSVTGDGQVTVYWSPPRDNDVVGFRVLISRDDLDYYRIVEVPFAQRHWVIRGASLPATVPFEFMNGTSYWLAIEAVDGAGNHSDLSDAAVTSDTPRPAGRDLRLYDVNGLRHAESGYDFSRSPYGYAMEGNALFTDVYYSWEGRPMLRTPHPSVVEMQDLGLMDMDDDRASRQDEAAWQPTDAVPLAVGHVIVLKVFEETRPGNDLEPFNVAKVRVVDWTSESADLDWAYQIQPNSRELKPAPAPIVASAQRTTRREVER